MVAPLAKGIWLGFSIAAPVGPIGILVLKQALQRGYRAGIASGFGAALADLIYGCLAVAGVQLFAGTGRIVAIVGGLVLLWLAWRSWHEPPAQDSAAAGGTITTFLLTLSNPMTILSFAAMIAGVGATAPAYFVAGVFLGSMLWWTILSFSAVSIRRWIEVRGVVLNRIAAITLGSLGVWAIYLRR